MAEGAVPYMQAYGNISKALEKLQQAATPERFTQDFLSTKLGLSGGSAKPVIPFLKRVGFLASDGSPTDLYKRFRNKAQAGGAAAAALRRGYGALFEINEYAHELKDEDLRGIIVQATGLEETSSSVRAMLGSFKALRFFARFDQEEDAAEAEDSDGGGLDTGEEAASFELGGLSLGYTINLHLPATSDIAVFNAIFRSLRENLLVTLEKR